LNTVNTSIGAFAESLNKDSANSIPLDSSRVKRLIKRV